jgi:hypothetical protein
MCYYRSACIFVFCLVGIVSGKIGSQKILHAALNYTPDADFL